MDTVIYSFIKKHSRSAIEKNPALNANNPMVGCIVASKKPSGKVGIGWSRCAVTRGDNFKKEIALKIALGRAEKGTIDVPPNSMLKAIVAMEDRAARYFKDSEVQIINSML
jgi:hypothetical protein